MADRSRSRSPVKDDSDCFLYIANLPNTWGFQQIQIFLRCTTNQTNQIAYVHVIKYNDVFKGECVVEFVTASACQRAAEILNAADVEGRKLEIVSRAKYRVPAASLIKSKQKKKRNSLKSWLGVEEKREKIKQMQDNLNKSDMDGNHETYGLSSKFLTDLGIVPPLTNRIYVTNLAPNVTETKLREVFSLAGHVVSTSVSVSSIAGNMIGKVLFDHPVEAVQAISMFQKKELYDRVMRVKMDTFIHTPIMPEGLSEIGMGLGPNGEPMTGVRHTIELEPLKKLLLNELEKLQESNRSRSHQSGVDNIPQQNNMWNTHQTNDGNPLHNLMQILQQNIGGNLSSITMALQQAMGSYNLQNQGVLAQVQQAQSRFDVPPSALTIAQNPIVNQNDLLQQIAYQQTSNVWHSQQAPKSRFDIPPSNVTQNVTPNAGQNWTSSGWSQTQMPSQASSYDRNVSGYGKSEEHTDDFDVQKLSDFKKSDDKASDMLLFTNLPSSVTPQALVNKMSEVGALTFAEITGQGRAVVRFQHRRDAERCLKLYDRSKVDGQVITVKFV